MMRKPKPLIIKKEVIVTAYEAFSGIDEGEKISWPDEISFGDSLIFNLKETRKLIKWLNRAEKWMSERQ